MTGATLFSRIGVDRASRWAVLLATMGAVAWEGVFGGWSRPLAYAEPLAFVAALIASIASPTLGRAAVLFAACTAPAVLRDVARISDLQASGIWIAALLGMVLSRQPLRGWSLPRPWRVPVVLWGLCIAVAWPIVVAREADFSLAQLFNTRLPVTGRGIAPRFESLWIAHVASVQLIGILWFDELFATFRDDRVARLERQVLWPLATGALTSIGLGLYQMAVDPLRLNPTIYGVMGRASGLMLDGNVFGTLSAMWCAGFVALALPLAGIRRATAAAASAAALVAVWGSGSRTSLLAASCAAVAAVYGTWTALGSRRNKLMVLVGAAAASILIVSVVAGTSLTTGPMDRIRLALERSRGNEQSVLEYLWERGGHGRSAVSMITEHPAVGVGVGSFHALVLDYSRALGPASAVGPDNAQNWFRHQLAELGLLGSLGWIAVAAILTAALVRPARGGGDARRVIVAGAIIGLGLASLLGMPTQHVVVLVTFWTFVFWHDRLRGAPSGGAIDPRAKAWHWIMVGTIVLSFAAGTLAAARTDLRVPHRALRFGWPYAYGFQDAEGADGEPFRRTGRRAVAVFQSRGPYLKLTFWAEHPDLESQPVRVRIWRGTERIVNVTLSSHARVTWYVRTPPDGSRWMMVETEVDRTWNGQAAGDRPRSDIGLALANWEFVQDPPRGTVVID